LREYRALADSWYLFDNSGKIPFLIAIEKKHKLRIIEVGQYQSLIADYGDE